MNKQLLRDGFWWGIALWFVGYILGIILFMVVPVSLIGWIITPIGMALTLWVLLKKVKSQSFQYFISIALIWAVIAVVFDYFFLVQVFKPEDGYYKLDVYVYYLSSFVLPLLVGWYRSTGALKK
jgi:hypothetical protein